MWEESKENRIRRRFEMYANGELSLDDLYLLESIDQDEEDHKKEKKLSLVELDEKIRSEKASEDLNLTKSVEAPLVGSIEEDLLHSDLGLVGSDTDDRKENFRSVLKSITKEEFRDLSLYEQQRLYDFDPEAVRKLLEKEKSVREILHEDPVRKFPQDLSVEEFRSMSLRDQNDLYMNDPDLYNRLVEEGRSE